MDLYADSKTDMTRSAAVAADIFPEGKNSGSRSWEEWLDTQLFLLAKETPMAGMGYNEIFRCLPKEKQEELMNRKAGFAKTAGIE